MSIWWCKNSLFNKWCWKNWTGITNKQKTLDQQITLYTRINSKWIKGLNIKHDTIKVLAENIGSKILNILRSNIFTSMSPRARDMKERINKWDYIKLKSFCMAKENISKMKRETSRWEYIFANDTSDKGLISKIYEELTHSTPRRQTIQLKNGQRTWTDTSPRTYRGPRDIWKDAQHY